VEFGLVQRNADLAFKHCCFLFEVEAAQEVVRFGLEATFGRKANLCGWWRLQAAHIAHSTVVIVSS
jgi:hypothetical protein